MRISKALSVGAAALLLGGCSDIFGCKEDSEILEAEFSSPFYNITLDLVAGYRQQGYDCDSESIRNASGTAIGTRYTCTKCG